jgi:uncharacterized OB-fold protein
VNIPAVARDGDTEEFFDATAAGSYLIRRCAPHGHASKPQALQCSTCGSAELLWEPASGDAKLISWAVLPAPASAVVAVAELAEGPWVWAALLCDDPVALSEGLPLRIGFERPPGSEAIPVLVPAAD